MKNRSFTVACALTVAALLWNTLIPTPAQAQDQDAAKILKTMTDYAHHESGPG
jgi:hypothetical protein